MSKFIEVGGIGFEVIKPHKVDPSEYHKDYLGRRTLWDFYDRPSDIKVGIWEEWLDWESDNPEVRDMRVTSASCFMFTIGAYYVDPETDEIIGYFKITRDHNRLYLYE